MKRTQWFSRLIAILLISASNAPDTDAWTPKSPKNDEAKPMRVAEAKPARSYEAKPTRVAEAKPARSYEAKPLKTNENKTLKRPRA